MGSSGNRMLIVHLCIVSALLNTFALAFSVFVIVVYDKVIGSNQHSLLNVAVSAAVLILFFDFIAKRLKAALVGQIRFKFEEGFNKKVSKQLFFENSDDQTKAKNLNNSLQTKAQISDFIGNAIPIFLVDLPFVFIFLVTIYIVAPNLFFVPFIAVLVLLVAMLVVGFQRGKSIEHHKRATHEFQNIFFSLLGSQNLVRTLPGSHKIEEKWKAASNIELQTSDIAQKKNFLISDLIQTVSQACQIGIVFWGTILYFGGQITFGVLFASVILTGRAFAPLAGVARIIGNFPQIRSAQKDLKALNSANFLESKQHSITNFDLVIANASLSFDQTQKPALERVNLHVKHGEKIGLVGPPGSGKTTLLRCIGGHIQPSHGQITLGGIDLKEIDPRQLTTNISLVDQFPTFFQGTVQENIDYGLKTKSDNQLEDLLAKFKKFDLLETIADTLNRDISSDARELTGGERKLVAALRSMITRPKILLLDEPTNSFDAEKEARFMAMIREEFQSETIVVASHRVEALSFVENLFILKDGKIVAEGPSSKFFNPISSKQQNAKQ